MIEDVERRIARLIAQVRHGIYPPAAVLDELRHADLFAPLKSLPVQAGAPLRMPRFTDEHDVKYLTLFTSVHRLELWAPPGATTPAWHSGTYLQIGLPIRVLFLILAASWQCHLRQVK